MGATADTGSAARVEEIADGHIAAGELDFHAFAVTIEIGVVRILRHVLVIDREGTAPTIDVGESFR